MKGFWQMADKIFKKLSAVVNLLGVLFCDLLKIKNQIRNTEEHIEGSLQWLKFAQDISGTGGVSAGYSLFTGWLKPYPETTGYIIPTFVKYFQLTGEKEYLERAKKMTDWLLSVQLENGSFQGGYDWKPEPRVFNTGQIIFGLTAIYKETKIPIYLEAAKKAGDWLVQVQDQDGCWRKHTFNRVVHTYNTRVAWALLELWQISKDDKYLHSAIRNIDWAKTQQLPNGFFENNTFEENVSPFSHTIDYAISGFLESGLILKRYDYIKVSQKCADALLEIFRKTNFIAGTYDRNWESRDKYTCLTGDAQISVTWSKLYQITKDPRYKKAALKINNFLKSTQNLRSQSQGIRGGIKGSYPICGKYSDWAYPNWGAKFFIDALILEKEITEKKNETGDI